MRCALNGEGFSLSRAARVQKEDVGLPVNTTLKVAVESENFRGWAVLDVDVRELIRFQRELTNLYRTLAGTARIQEPYGYRMSLRFVGNGRGQITGEGDLRSRDGGGNDYRLSFSQVVDQTCLEPFLRQMAEICGE